MNNTVTPGLIEIKNEFYEWCSMLSLDEVAANTALLSVIERIERMFLALEG